MTASCVASIVIIVPLSAITIKTVNTGKNRSFLQSLLLTSTLLTFFLRLYCLKNIVINKNTALLSIISELPAVSDIFPTFSKLPNMLIIMSITR